MTNAMRNTIALTVILLTSTASLCPAGDRLTPIELGKVKVGGEIGRRIDVTVRNNLLALDADKDFLPQFVKKDKPEGYIGLGKLIDSAVRLAAYTGDPRVVALKKHLVEEARRNQLPDGYPGLIKPDKRVWALWDIHELGDTYCCPCNYRRIVADLPGLVYYRTSEGGLAVNLYAASTAQVELAEDFTAQVRQTTDYPRDGQVKLELTLPKPRQFPLQLRIPAWSRKPTVRVNGQDVPDRSKSEGWLAIDRLWNSGDQVTLDLPMPWRLVKGRKAQAGRVAVLRGPMLYCLSRKDNAKTEKIDLRLVTIDPKSLQGPLRNTAIPGGKACTVRGWGPGAWYPMSKPDLTLTLTEFADPDGQALFFNVPNPHDAGLVDDELIAK